MKEVLGMNLHSKLVYDEKYIKAKTKIFNGVVNAIFWNDEISKEDIHYTCIAAINIDSVKKKDKENYPQVYLEEWEYDIKKKKMVRFTDAELALDDSDNFDSEQLYLAVYWGKFYTCEPQTQDPD